MNKILYFFILLSVSFGFSQSYNVPYRKGNLWGYADKLGKIIIEPKYDSVSTENNNLRWLVYKNGKTGVVNIEGKEQILVEYDSIFRIPVHSEFNEFEVYKNGIMGYTEMDGKFILPVKFKSITKVKDDSFNQLELKFFVQNKDEVKYKLITQNNTELLNDIDNFNQFKSWLYKIQINKMYGIYDVISKTWKINAEYDSIKYFEHKNFYRPKEEFKDIKYYGLKLGKIYLFTKTFHLVNTNYKNIDDFFNKTEMSDDYYVSSAITVGENYESNNLFKVTGDKYVESKVYKTQDFHREDVKIFIIKDKEKFHIKTNSLSFNSSKKFLFDEILLLKSNFSGKYDPKFALVRNKKKWSLFSLCKNELVSEIIFDSFEFDKKFKNILLLKYKNKIGLYQLEDDNYDEISTIIEPIYNSFDRLDHVLSNDGNFNSFYFYYFLSDGKLCPVGMNGIKFYQD